jgi:hypothetical protein
MGPALDLFWRVFLCLDHYRQIFQVEAPEFSSTVENYILQIVPR